MAIIYVRFLFYCGCYLYAVGHLLLYFILDLRLIPIYPSIIAISLLSFRFHHPHKFTLCFHLLNIFSFEIDYL